MLEPATTEELYEQISRMQKCLDELEADLLVMGRHAEHLEVAAGIHGGYAQITIDPKASRCDFLLNGSGPARDSNVVLHALAQTVDDGYDVGADGTRYKRVKAGPVMYWVTQDGHVLFVTTRKPERTNEGDALTYTWGGVEETNQSRSDVRIGSNG